MRLIGRARDIVTPPTGGAPIVCAEDSFDARLKADRTIVAIEADPPRVALARLVGSRGGGRLRSALEHFVPDERRQATPLYLILDDISGASLVAPWAWSQWDSNWLASAGTTAPQLKRMVQDMEGICTGFAPGSSSLDPHRIMDRASDTPAPDLRHPQDPHGWHAFTLQDTVGMRRARRIDVRLDEVIVIDAAFQDSASKPDGSRAALHEYQLAVTADPESLRLLSIEAIPRVLPFAECPGAVMNISRLLGARLPELRQKVLDELPGTLGCTHLNDALRSLAEVPALLDHLRSIH
ncbi:MAG TPA: DUF2889 domain-containing protein [Steroidobacteraceae bacterium]|nr:DUF2889 domain-containing protein [Steroidobacteraceae bacterium]